MVSYKYVLSALSLSIMLMMVACSPRSPSLEKQPPSQETARKSPPVSSQPRQTEWERLVQAAKKEGQVVLITSATPAQREAFISVFKGRYGIDLEFITGRAAETVAKLFTERKAGLYTVDLYLRGTTTALDTLKPAGLLDPLEPVLVLPEVIDPKVWWGEKLRWADQAHYMLTFMSFPSGKVGINTDLVKAGEIKSYQNLLEPRWKGKFTMNDPTVSGSGYRWFHTVARFILNVDYMRALARQEPVILRDQRVQVEWLVRGKYPVAISPHEGTITDFLSVGGVSMTVLTPREGGYLTAGGGAIALINKAPHPNAAKLFVNWLLTREGQTIYSKTYGAQSARVDVPTDYLNPWSLRESGVKYVDVMDEEFDTKADEYLKLAKEIFGDLLK